VISIPHVVASYLFVPWENPYGRFYPILILGWTLNFEMFFYAMFAIALRYPRRAVCRCWRRSSRPSVAAV